MTNSHTVYEVLTAKGAVISTSPERDIAIASAMGEAERFPGLRVERVTRTFTETRQGIRWETALRLVGGR